MPYVATSPQYEAKSTDPSTWSTFTEAQAAYERGEADGIGFVLGDGYIGFDQDGTLDRTHLDLLRTYTERSPGGNGVHAIARGVKPGPRCRTGAYELYSQGRYFTVTGHHIDGFPATVEGRTAEIRALYEQLFPEAPIGLMPTGAVVPALLLPDDDLVPLAVGSVNGDKFLRLWRGDTSGYPSHSEADAAMCCLLAFWTNRNPEQMDRLFRQSGLYRDKWDSKRGDRTYGALVIERAIRVVATTYGSLRIAPVVRGITGMRGLHGIR